MDQQEAPGNELTWRRPLRYILRNWRLRHQRRGNLILHLFGIPLTVLGVWLFFTLPWAEWYWGAAAFVLGYLLQYLGHRIEGNDVGEWAAIKRFLGLPYVAIAPQQAAANSTPNLHQSAI